VKVKTSITLDKDLLEAIDSLSGKSRNRSEFIKARDVLDYQVSLL
jgi:metal-responsive CopG/Arc/MetJ family transcriptional regulator